MISTGSSNLLRGGSALEFERFQTRAFEHLLWMRDGKAAAFASFTPLDEVASFGDGFRPVREHGHDLSTCHWVR